MSLTTIIGFIVAIGGIVVGCTIEHVSFSSLVGPSAFLIVVIGSVGATTVSHTGKDFKALLSIIKYVFVSPKLDFAGTVEALVGMAETARKNGLLSLQDDAEKASHPLIKRGLVMAVDGADQEKVKAMLEFISHEELEKFHHGAAVLNTSAGYMPTIGIMGTVMGMTAVMKNLDKPETLGPSIAVAFLATLYGVGFANLIMAPMASHITAVSNEVAKFNEMIIAGVLGIQEGENPRNLREKLEVYGAHDHGKGGKTKEKDKDGE